MRRATIILFFAGLAFGVVGFLIRQADQMRWLLRVVSPGYVRGMQGVETLDANQPVRDGDVGFAEISHLIMLDLRKSEPAEFLDRIEVRQMQPFNQHVLGLGGAPVKDMQIRVTFSNGQVRCYWTKGLQTRLSDLHSARLFWAACVVFGVGVIVQLASFVLQQRQQTREKPAKTLRKKPTA
jgi:hypothetical protein